MKEFFVFDQIPIGLFIIDKNFKIVFWNACIEDWIGRDRKAVLNQDVRDVFTRLSEKRYQSRLDQLFHDRLPIVLSYQLNGNLFSSCSIGHNDRIHHCTITAIEGSGGSLALFALEDRTEVAQRIKTAREDLMRRYEIEKELRHALTDKEILMKEINHRVKNNLNMVRSMIFLQRSTLTEETGSEMFRDLESRISSISLLHEMLYKSSVENTILLDEYLKSICENIFSTFLSESTFIRLSMDLENVTVSTDFTLHAGLIVSELLINAIKYGMKDRNEGIISVSLKRKDANIELEIADDGPGMPEGFDISNATSLGMKLVAMITQQMKGRHKISSPDVSGRGARFSFSLPVPRQA